MATETHFEQYEFQCGPCDRRWQITYEVRETGSQSDSRWFYLTGVPATPPTAGRLCPNCWKLASPPLMVDGPVLARAHP
jgi:hypothetical protein